MLRAALAIAARILRQRIRDRSAILFAVVTPLGLALAFSALIPNEFSSFNTTIAVVDEDGGELATALTDHALAQLVEAGVADIREVSSEAEGRDLLERAEAGAVVIIPPGFTASVSGGSPTEIRLLGGEFPVSLELARSAVGRFAGEIGAHQLLLATTTAGGGSLDPQVQAAAAAALEEPPPVQLSNAVTANHQAALATYYGAAMAIMFVFFATQYGALAIHADRQAGTLPRLLAAPIPPAAILLGTSLAGLLLGAVAMTVLAVGTTVLAGAAWGPPPLVALLIAGAVVVAMGLSTVVATFARTSQQANGLNAIVAIAMASVGGVFVPLSQAPDTMVTLSQITPHAWFLRGIDILTDPASGPADIALPVAVLFAIGLVLLALGLARSRTALVPR